MFQRRWNIVFNIFCEYAKQIHRNTKYRYRSYAGTTNVEQKSELKNKASLILIQTSINYTLNKSITYWDLSQMKCDISHCPLPICEHSEMSGVECYNRSNTIDKHEKCLWWPVLTSNVHLQIWISLQTAVRNCSKRCLLAKQELSGQLKVIGAWLTVIIN